MSGEEERAGAGGSEATNGLNGHTHTQTVNGLRSPSRKRRKSDSFQEPDEVAPPPSSASPASPASSLAALAEATASLASLPEQAGTVLERMQRQLEHEREAREAAESDKRRLEEHVQRLEQSSKQQQQQQQQSAPSTPLQHSHAASPAPHANGTPQGSPSPFTTPTPSLSALSPLESVPAAARGVLAAELGALFPAVSEEDGDERGVSCHQCKSNKAKHLLLFCTTKADSSGRKRRCRKKYCDACLRRSYHQVISLMSAEDLISWRCPSCMSNCSCAACLRRGHSRSSPSSATHSASPSGSPSAAESTATSPVQRNHTVASTPPAQPLSATPGPPANGSSLHSVSAPPTPSLGPSAAVAPPTLLHGFPYPLAMSGMSAAIPVPFAFQPFHFQPAMVAAAAAAAAAASAATAAASAPSSSNSVHASTPPAASSLSVPSSPVAHASASHQPFHTAMAGMTLPGLLHSAHLSQAVHSGMAPFTFPLMSAPLTSSAFLSSATSSSSLPRLHPQLVMCGLPSVPAQHSQAQQLKASKAAAAVEAAQARNGEAQSAIAAG